MNKLDLLSRFSTRESSELKEELAKKFIDLAIVIDSSETESREKTIAIERLEESFMWATKGIVYEDI
jgi:hypothetical protein